MITRCLANVAAKTESELLFNDHLAIVSSSGGEHIGSFAVSSSVTQHHTHGTCLLVHANSQGTVGGVICGTLITAYLSRHRLETVEHRQHEFAVVIILLN